MIAGVISSLNSYAQLIAVLVVFVLVLLATAVATKWVANFQKQQSVESNIEVMETIRLSSSKYLQIVRVGETYISIAVCKDTVTMLCEVPKEQLRTKTPQMQKPGFQEMLKKAMKKDISKSDEPEEM